jgi:HlyD family secretion protein
MKSSPQLDKQQSPLLRLTPASSWICALALLPPLFAADGCSFEQMSSKGPAAMTVPSDPAAVKVTAVETRDLTHSIEIPGTVEGIETASLYAKVGGYLKTIHVDIGDRVKQGDILATLDVPELDQQLAQKRAEIDSATAQVRQAEAAIRQATAELASSQAMLDESKTLNAAKAAELKLHEAELARITELVDKGVLEPKKLDEIRFSIEIANAGIDSVAAKVRTAVANRDAKTAAIEKAETDREAKLADVAVADAELDQVMTMQAYTKIVSPLDGVVVRRNVDTGAFIQSAAANSVAKPMLVVSRTDAVRIAFDLPMSEVRWLDHEDTAVFHKIEALPEALAFQGKVTRYASALNATSRMMRVEIELPNEDGQLMPGFYGYVHLTLKVFPNTSTIPASALLATDGQTFVYVVEENICKRRDVTVSYQDGDVVGISTGLVGGELVIKTGGSQLSEDDEVTPIVEESLATK